MNDDEIIKFTPSQLSELLKTGNIRPVNSAPRQEIRITSEEAAFFEQVREIFESDYLGPDAVERAFGIRLNDIPEIPYNMDELKRAKELGQLLILRVDKFNNGDPITMRRLMVYLQNKMNIKQKDLDIKDKITYDYFGNKGLPFYDTQTPTTRWALVSKRIIPGSANMDYLEQTELLASYIQNRVFVNRKVPDIYQKAIEDFNQYKSGLRSLIAAATYNEQPWGAVTRLVSNNLSINRLLRQTPVEAFYDLLIRGLQYDNLDHANNDSETLLYETISTWTNTHDNMGGFITLGGFMHDLVDTVTGRIENGSSGLNVQFYYPSSTKFDIGVVLSR